MPRVSATGRPAYRPHREYARLHQLDPITLDLHEQRLGVALWISPVLKRDVDDLQGVSGPSLDQRSQTVDLLFPLPCRVDFATSCRELSQCFRHLRTEPCVRARRLLLASKRWVNEE